MDNFFFLIKSACGEINMWINVRCTHITESESGNIGLIHRNQFLGIWCTFLFIKIQIYVIHMCFVWIYRTWVWMLRTQNSISIDGNEKCMGLHTYIIILLFVRLTHSESALQRARNTISVSRVAVPQLQHEQRQMTSSDLAQHEISSYTFSLVRDTNIVTRQMANEWTRESPVKEKHQIVFSLRCTCSGWVGLIFVFRLSVIVY